MGGEGSGVSLTLTGGHAGSGAPRRSAAPAARRWRPAARPPPSALQAALHPPSQWRRGTARLSTAAPRGQSSGASPRLGVVTATGRGGRQRAGAPSPRGRLGGRGRRRPRGLLRRAGAAAGEGGCWGRPPLGTVSAGAEGRTEPPAPGPSGALPGLGDCSPQGGLEALNPCAGERPVPRSTGEESSRCCPAGLRVGAGARSAAPCLRAQSPLRRPWGKGGRKAPGSLWV